jgi:glycerol kinase
VVSKAQYGIAQHYPHPGWVEHDSMEILHSQLRALDEAFEISGLSNTDIAAIGITNQRETAVVWDKKTGKPVYNAIVWQCRRTAAECERLKADGMESFIREKTGLIIDAYFTGTKYKWILDNVPGARARAEKGELLCGTIESWLIWNLTGGVHVSDYSNASRTMLFDIRKLGWDLDLCKALSIPESMLPVPVQNSMEYGKVRRTHALHNALDGVPIMGAAGDQQAALFGQACFSPGQIKNTYGTGCFTLANIGASPEIPGGELLVSVGWSFNGNTDYVLEGSVFNAGSAIQWLRDELGLISSSHECDVLAESVPDNGGVYFVPAFTGLGAPYWDMYARGAVFGLTRGCTKAHLARAVLESIAYQVADLIGSLPDKTRNAVHELRVDGGAAISDFLMQFQADILQIPVRRPKTVETTALGAAYLAGLSAGLWKDTAEIESMYNDERLFYPRMDKTEARQLLLKWHKAVDRSLRWSE